MSATINVSDFSLSQVDRGGPFPEGVATVWLLSTLGSSTGRIPYARSNINEGPSTSSAVKKKDIINVSIPDTCMIIQSNEMKLPLRYVSNLLYGVTVCYYRKTEYVLSDLTSLLAQLQKRIYSGQGRATHKKSLDANQKLASTTILTSGGKNENGNGFLSDDLLFDISQVSNFENMLGMAPAENISGAMTIRKQDYLRELTNSNAFERQLHGDGSDSLEGLNRSITLDDIPIDMDFNLDIDDVASQQGTATGSSTESRMGSNSNFDVNFNNQDFTLNFDDERFESNEIDAHGEPTAAPNAPLGLPEGKDDDETSLEGEYDGNGPALKRFKTARALGAPIIPRMIHYDERTGLSTEILRSNHNGYCELMDSKRKTHESRSTLRSWQQIMDLEKQPEFMQRCWNFVLNGEGTGALGLVCDRVGYNSDSIERGRKRSNSISNSERSSSNVPSEEMGRRMVSSRENSFHNDNDNLLLNLDQIDEELELGQSRTTSTHQDFLQMNLDLPPSSFGRTHTRTGTRSDTFGAGSNKSGERDPIDILYHRTRGTAQRKTTDQDRPSTTATSDTSRDSFADAELVLTQLPFQVVLDHQARKFYEYIKERSLFVGKTTRSNPPFKRKLLFEDIVPSRLTADDEKNENEEVKANKMPTISKKIAANAFLSLLNLASKELVDIREYEEGDVADRFRVMKSDDIVVYA